MLGEISITSYANDTTLMAESEEELKSLLMKVKVKSEKVCLKLNIQKTKIIASGRITSWQIVGETVSDFILWGSKITVNGDCSHVLLDYTLDVTVGPSRRLSAEELMLLDCGAGEDS